MNKDMLHYIMVLMLSHNVAWGMIDNVFPTKLPLDQFVEVLSYCKEEKDWARLRMTCKWFENNLSIRNPSLEIIQHQSFRTGQENVQSLAFNAAWHGNFEGLKVLMKHMKQIDYKYSYSIPDVSPFGHFDLLSIIKAKMSKMQQIIISNEAKKNNCELEFYNYNVADCTGMRIACYNRESFDVGEPLPYVDNMEWCHLIGIAISRNGNKCINALCQLLKLKMQKISPDLDNMFKNNEYYQALSKPAQEEKADLFCRVLKITMNVDKYDAFEIVVKNNPFDCLNYVFERSEKVAICETILDRLVIFSQGKPEQKKYIDTYIQYGGKRHREFLYFIPKARCKQKDEEECIIS